MKNGLFWVFGIIQCLSLGCIIFLLFKALGTINGGPVIGLDTSITLSVIFPLFLLIVEYLIYTKE